MQFLITAFALASAITVATCSSIQINYYTDSSCSKYTTQYHPSISNGCYNYQWGSQRSASIAGCSSPNENYCFCYFYSDGNCQDWAGTEFTDYHGNQEASGNGCVGGQVQSVKCVFTADAYDSKVATTGETGEIGATD